MRKPKVTPYRKGRMVLTTIQVKPAVLAEIDRIAKERDESRASVIREALDGFVEQQQAQEVAV